MGAQLFDPPEERHYRISATPTFCFCVIDNNNEIQWILRLPKYVQQTQSQHTALHALRIPTYLVTCTVVYCMVLHICTTYYIAIAEQHVYSLLCLIINTQFLVFIYFRKDPEKRNPDIFSLLLLEGLNLHSFVKTSVTYFKQSASHIPFAYQDLKRAFCRNILSNFASVQLLVRLLSIFSHSFVNFAPKQSQQNKFVPVAQQPDDRSKSCVGPGTYCCNFQHTNAAQQKPRRG